MIVYTKRPFTFVAAVFVILSLVALSQTKEEDDPSDHKQHEEWHPYSNTRNGAVTQT